MLEPDMGMAPFGFPVVSTSSMEKTNQNKPSTAFIDDKITCSISESMSFTV